MQYNLLDKEYVLKSGVDFNELESDLEYPERMIQPGTEDEGFTGLTYELYDNGKLAYYCFYKFGVEHGEYVEFYKNGMIKSYAIKEYGSINGEYQRWDDKGNLVEQGEGKFRIKLRYKKWNSEGEIIAQKDEPTESDKEWIRKRELESKENLKAFDEWHNKRS